MKDLAAAQRERRALKAGRLRLQVTYPRGPRGPKVLVPVPVLIPCEVCGESFQPKRKTARYCSTRCRVAHHRARCSQPSLF